MPFLIFFKDTGQPHCLLKSKQKAINYCKENKNLEWDQYGYLDDWITSRSNKVKRKKLKHKKNQIIHQKD